MSRRWRVHSDGFSASDLSTSWLRFEAAERTLSQAIRAAASEAEPDADRNLLFGHIRGTVVGLRYYTGVVNRGEMVGLVREPNNPYDANAVMVSNVYGRQVGHIKKELAAAMARVMDTNLAKVEGVVPYGATNKFNMPVVLSFWGKEENKEAVVLTLGRHGFKLDPTGLGIGTKTVHVNPGSYTSTHKKGSTVTLTPEELKNAFDNLFEGLMESKDGEKEAAQAVSTPLLPHQKQALSWMCSRENRRVLPPFWEKRGALYYNTVTHFSTRETPERLRGGILADDMGLGKTLTTIALILTNFHQGKPLPVDEETPSPLKASAPTHPTSTLRGTASTSTSTLRGGSGKGGAAGGTDGADGGSSAATSAAASAPLSSDIRQVELIGADGAASVGNTGEKSAAKDRTKASKRKPKSLLTLQDDSCFAAALLGAAAPTPTVPKKKCKKSNNNNNMADRKPGSAAVEPSGPEEGDDPSLRTTLIICPLSVLSNWLEQFEQHVSASAKLRVYLYYGSERSRSQHFLSSQDVVITTYNVLSAERAGGGPLFSLQWLRVVLDEGHMVRNPNAHMSKAVLQLKACRRWVLSGTPMQNHVKDLFMLLAFLRVQPFHSRDWWNRVIQRPVTQGDPAGLKNLQTLVKCITLRRTKSSRVDGRPLVVLPQKDIQVEQVELSQRERAEYDLARNQGRDVVRRYVTEGTVMTNYADVLSILMKLRQLCCHPDLGGGAITQSDSAAAPPAELRERLIEKLRSVLSSGSDEECSVCLDSLHLPVITHCAHVYCQPCIIQVISSYRDDARCPLCRSVVAADQLVECPPRGAEEDDGDEGSASDAWRTSSKVQALLGNLLRLRDQDVSIKSLVVSQFTRFLSILEVPLRLHGFSFVRLDGTLSQKKRTQVIETFQSSAPNGPTIMLLSLKAGGVGLNLTAASRVFLMEPAWNPASEEQCIDRCHRLGQSRRVEVTKFIVQDSVEEAMVKVQRRKRDLAQKMFGSSDAERSSSHIQDIRTLLEL